MADIELTIPTPDDFRKAYLRVVRAGLVKRGVPNPNVTDNSDYAVKAEALAQQLSVATSQLPFIVDSFMPDTATGANLVRLMGIYGLQVRPAQGASGNIVHSASAAGLVTAGAQLYDDKGQIYEVTVGGTYDDGDEIPVQGVSVGKATNHDEGDVLQWVTPPPFANSKVEVSTGGLRDGIDEDTDQVGQRRLLQHLKNTPGGGNWAQVVQWAEQSTASVHAAFVYPAIDGPATFGVCLLGQLTYDSVTGFSRGVTAATLTTATSYIGSQGPIPPNALNITTPDVTASPNPNQSANVSIGLTLPEAPTATPPGPGGGWTDGKPWPNLLGTAVFVSVSSVTSGTSFTITSNDAASCPTSTDAVTSTTQIAWFDQAAYAAGDPAIKTSTVLTVGGSIGAITVTIDPLHPFTGIAIGDFIFPAAENIENYAQAFLGAMAEMGPGQWTSNPTVLVHARRQPLTTHESPSDLGGSQLRAISDSGDEVLDTSYLYKNPTIPAVPASTAESPKVLVPGKLGFYQI